MSRKKRRNFEDSLINNRLTYDQYFKRLMELSMSMFEWSNLPDGIDARFLELTLFSEGQAVFFYDEDMGESGSYLCLQVATGTGFNVYRVPINRRAYASNGYNRELNNENSVIIYNNLLRTNSVLDVRMFAERLFNLDRTIDINVNSQKTPILILCDESQKLTMENIYMEYMGNQPVIFGHKGLNRQMFDILRTEAPFVSPELYQLKMQYWNEALTYLGISNINITKKERLITDEVTRNQGGTIASRYSRLESRREAVKKINDMFNLDIEVNYREDFQYVEEAIDTIDSEVKDDDLGGVDNE